MIYNVSIYNKGILSRLSDIDIEDTSKIGDVLKNIPESDLVLLTCDAHTLYIPSDSFKHRLILPDVSQPITVH